MYFYLRLIMRRIISIPKNKSLFLFKEIQSTLLLYYFWIFSSLIHAISILMNSSRSEGLKRPFPDNKKGGRWKSKTQKSNCTFWKASQSLFDQQKRHVRIIKPILYKKLKLGLPMGTNFTNGNKFHWSIFFLIMTSGIVKWNYDSWWKNANVTLRLALSLSFHK